MKSEFEIAFNEIAQMRDLPRDIVLEALRSALVTAYRKDKRMEAQRVEVEIDPASGRARIYAEKEVVESVISPDTEIDLEKARYYDPNAQYGDMVMVQIEGSTKKLGRIAAQAAKQVITQTIRHAEHQTLLKEFKEREGDVVQGTVQNNNGSTVTFALGRAEATMPRKEQIPGERYKQHEKLRVYIVKVEETPRGPSIIVSRSHRNMLRRLLEFEVPEIFSGQIEIKNIAREPGARSKVAVAALQDGIDPVGACIGQQGKRIQNIASELHERIDVIEWFPNHEQFIAKALSPARVSGVYLNDDPDEGRTALVIVPEDSLSLAIGRDGQNARLAAKLTGWRIDIKSVPEAITEALDAIDLPPLNALQETHGEMINDVRRIIAKLEMKKSVTQEEFNVMNRFADLAQRRLQQMNEQRRKKRMEEIAAVRETLPAAAFHMPIDQLEVAQPIREALRIVFASVGEVMLRFIIDEGRIRSALRDLPKESFKALQDALDKLIIPQEAYDAAEAEAQARVDEQEAQPVAEDAVEPGLQTAHDMADSARRGRQPTAQTGMPTSPAASFEDDNANRSRKDGGKKKGKTRQLVYDEDRGGMVVKRQRGGKAGRSIDWDWEE
jgi:N utilization substance protein A